MSPSNGQPNAVATAPITFFGLAPARRQLATSGNPAIVSSTLRLRFLRLWVFEAEQSSTSASTGVRTARSAARKFGTKADRRVSERLAIPANTSSASAIWGTAFGDTNDVTS